MLVKPQPTVENGEIAVVLIEDEATLKKFFKEDKVIRLEPANKKMKPIIIKEGKSKIIIVGRIIALLRNIEGKTTPFKRM